MEPNSSDHMDKEHEPSVISDVSMDIIDHHRADHDPATESQNHNGHEDLHGNNIVKYGQDSHVSVTVTNMKDSPLAAAVKSVMDSPVSMSVKNDSISGNTKHVLPKAEDNSVNGQGLAKDKCSKIPPAERAKLAAALYDPDSDRNGRSLLHPDAAVTSPSPTKEVEPNLNPDTVNEPATNDAHLSNETNSESPKPRSWLAYLTGDQCTEWDRPNYVKDYAALPADRDIGYPHIVTGRPRGGIDECRWDQANLRAADGIVTYLHRCTGLPRALEQFLDLDEDFCLATEGNAGVFEGNCFSITRYENIVEAGFYYKWKGERIWEPRVEYEIADDGKWVPRSALVGLGHEMQYDEFLTEGIGSILAFDLIWNDQLERNSTTTMYDAVNDNGQLVTQVWHRGGYENDHSEGE